MPWIVLLGKYQHSTRKRKLKVQKLILSASLSPALLVMATLNLHAASGTCIDCIHGCPA